MISATSLNASSALNKGPQIPLGLENGRMRVDSQKFLVPSLPVSTRALTGSHHHATDPKRRERSIVNGTVAHAPLPGDNPFSHHQSSHHHLALSHNYNSNQSVNGLRSPYGSPHGGQGSGGSFNGSINNPASPHNSNSSNNPRSSPHHPFSHLSSSPRKDAHSPMYAGEVPGLSPGSGGESNYRSRSSMPIPCSSPAAASSASPKGLHSHSPSSGTHGSGSCNYSPKLPTGPAMLPPPPTGVSDLSSLAAAGRLYPGFLAPHPSVPAHLNQAFYAAAAAAAASHSIPYPIFGPHYSHHPHSAAAASAYLDSFHSAIMSRGPGDMPVQQRSRSPSPQPPPHSRGGQGGSGNSHGTYHHAQQQSQNNHHVQSPQSTSVTSFHNKLIESTSVSSERHGFSGHQHHAHQHSSSSSGRYSPSSLGISKGGPLGISGGIMNLPSSRLSNGPTTQKSNQPENLVVQKSHLNGYPHQHQHGPPPPQSSKGWVEHPGLVSSDKKIVVNEMEASKDSRYGGIPIGNNGSEMMYKDASMKHKMLIRSPEEIHQIQQKHHQLQQLHHHPHSKVPKALTFTSDSFQGMNDGGGNVGKSSNIHRIPNPYAHLNGHGSSLPHSSSNLGVLTDSNNAKKQVTSNHLNDQYHSQHNQGNRHPTFLPPSPKKRSGNWNFAVPANPLSKLDLPPPPPPPQLSTLHHSVQNFNASSVHDSPTNNKYLTLNQNKKPSNNNYHNSSLPVPGPNPFNSIATDTNFNKASSSYLSSSAGHSAQLSPYPLSPSLKKAGSGPSTPKSPSVHQVKFTFSSGNSKENLNGLRKPTARNDSSSSTSSTESSVPWPVEQMPLIDAFRRGSLIKLASGDLKPVEELRAEDFIHAAANTSDSLRIIHCTVLSIQGDSSSNGKSLCKVTMAIGSQVQNQQVDIPFYILFMVRY
jgi:hypothetical protein